ncbi:hypothetical protein ACFPMF_18170 [Larkinella bovis]|uniref:RNA polymerase sigma-70 region 2 domain-containing protein n=1 Tax=Larkinella bovis TaxID=683041 RepID=A0ABW0ICQ6_9BACT
MIKDAGAAEQMVDAIFAEMQAEDPDFQTRHALETYLFIHLRTKCLAYLRTANKSQLLRSPSGEKPADRPEGKSVFWPVFIKENFLIRPILRFF